MSNDFGTIKAMFPSAVQNGPAAPLRRPAGAGPIQATPTRAVEEAKNSAQTRMPLDEVVSELNDLVRELHRELQFSVDQDSGDTVIRVVDRETEEIVRQIPSEEALRLRKRVEEMTGAIFHDSA